ncbi:hypothetical protein [Bacillus cereus]|uniref:hypothetical protein n=1 Tax=Bacillus cereus TaxID=1396 RepID=UPI000279D54C|nr:hypothetical protein [Bacillus cereus]EJR89773.1 hypothetical protein IKG_06001 [Bacillus cereus VD200]
MKVRPLWIIGSLFGLLYSFWRLFGRSLAGNSSSSIYYEILTIFPVLLAGIGVLSCFLYKRYQKIANVLLCFSISNAIFLNIENILNIIDEPTIIIDALAVKDIFNELGYIVYTIIFIFFLINYIFPMIYFIFTSISLVSLIKNKRYKPYYFLILISTLILICFRFIGSVAKFLELS